MQLTVAILALRVYVYIFQMFKSTQPFFTVVVNPFLFFCVIVCLGCNNDIHRNNSHSDISFSDIRKGKELAIQYCQSCHLLPDPSLLDSKTWEKGVLPVMGPRLGIFHFRQQPYRVNRYDMDLDKNFYPRKPLLKDEEWKNVVDYYTATSPDTIINRYSSAESIKTGFDLFTVKSSNIRYDAPATTLVKINAGVASPFFVVSDATKQTLYRYNKSLEIVDSFRNNGPVVDVEFHDKQWLTCDVGVLNPNNGKFGTGRSVGINSYGKFKKPDTALFDKLARPVQISSADFNGDGKTDYLVCEFGYQMGELTWMQNLGDQKFEKHVLRSLPGALKAYIEDYNHDGLPDFWVLFAQGDEGVILYTNKGNGQFEQKQVLRFPPVYGSSYLEFDDFNKDGYPDILYTCGDNADYSTIFKPYHGVYIFLNDGKNNFQQKFFFHINGCYKALARDFDNDGDLDIATISFFADYRNRPEEGFLYLNNTGGFRFTPYSLPETQQGRWLTMDAGDVNGDGKTDLILGNFSIGPAMIKSTHDWKLAPPFLVLENTGKKPRK